MTADFPEELRAALTSALGFPIAPLERLDGRTTLNFKAVRETDGFVFAVKCAPPEKRESFMRIARYLDALGDGGGMISTRLFAGRFDSFRGYDVMCLSWCDGVRLFPDRLSEEQVKALVDDYLVLSAAMQRVRPEGAGIDYPAMRRRAIADCGGIWAGGVRRILEEELTEDRIADRPALMKVIHGDMHHGNFLFRDGGVAGFFDFECITGGYPAEDFIRYFVCASEHLRWYGQHRKRRILKLFGVAVRRSPFTCGEWTAAIDRALLDKIAHKVKGRGCGLLMAVNLMFRAKYYRKLKQVAAAACANRNLKEE